MTVQPKLVGDCNRCGLCCMDGDLRCHYLRVTNVPGMPNATSCSVYNSRVPGMPIAMVNSKGVVDSIAYCAHDTPFETHEIITKGIGKGCSLRVLS